GRSLVTDAPHAGADRRLGEPAVAPAREPFRVREGDRALRRQISARRGAAPAALVGLPRAPHIDGVLAGPAVPPARPRRVQARDLKRALGQDADVSVTFKDS